MAGDAAAAGKLAYKGGKALKEAEDGGRTLYHCTSEAGEEGIRKSGKRRPSRPGRAMVQANM